MTCDSGETAITVLQGFTLTGGYSEDGGGMYNYDNSNPTVINCIFSNNTAYFGGGMRNYNSSPTVTNCIFSDNTASGSGGMRNSSSNPTVTSCTFTDNTAGGYGGGMHNDQSNPTVTNCILWGNSAGAGGNEIYNELGTYLDITYSCIQGGYERVGNIDSNPLFIDTQNDDLRLTAESPCIDVGNNAAIPVGIVTDLDGNPRIVNDVVDMGAYELQPSCTELLALAVKGDINFNGIVNILDLAILATHWLESSE